MVSNVNLPNKGQMCDVPLGSIVKTNEVFSGNSVKLVQAGRLPDAVQALVIRHIYNQESVVKGIAIGNREQVFAAFINDPQCSGLTLEEARNLFNKMVENTKKYL